MKQPVNSGIGRPTRGQDVIVESVCWTIRSSRLHVVIETKATWHHSYQIPACWLTVMQILSEISTHSRFPMEDTIRNFLVGVLNLQLLNVFDGLGSHVTSKYWIIGGTVGYMWGYVCRIYIILFESHNQIHFQYCSDLTLLDSVTAFECLWWFC